MPFHGGNKVRPRINVTTGKKTFNWLFDTGATITCMNADSFRESFGHSKPRLLKKVLAALRLKVPKWIPWASMKSK